MRNGAIRIKKLYLELTLPDVELAQEAIHDVAGEKKHVSMAILIQTNLCMVKHIFEKKTVHSCSMCPQKYED
jgi:hypothetical protein